MTAKDLPITTREETPDPEGYVSQWHVLGYRCQCGSHDITRSALNFFCGRRWDADDVYIHHFEGGQ